MTEGTSTWDSSAAVGGSNVLAARDVRRPNRLLRRLFSLDRRLEPCCLVGVGGMTSSPLWLSPVKLGGEYETSSPSRLVMLVKLPRRGKPPMVPKMLAPLPRDPETVFCAVKGVLGVPNSGRGCDALPNMPRLKVGVAVTGGKDDRLDGVSGMTAEAGISSTLRFRFEMRPVDMKAAGSGLAILYAAGVANASASGCGAAGRAIPMGSERARPCGRCTAVRGGGMCVGDSPAMLDAEDDGVRALESGCGCCSAQG